MKISVTYHHCLCPKLWDNMNLKPEVSRVLLKIANAFIEYVDLPIKPIDILLVGSAANYTWNSNSDIDLQILASLEDLPHRDSVAAKEYLDTKKKVFKRDYKLNVKNMPVEVTVSQPNDLAHADGIWSLLKNAWLDAPTYEPPDFDHDKVEKLADKWKSRIVKLVKNPDSTWRDIEAAYRKIQDHREGHLEKEGEFSETNLAYKALRKKGYIDMLKDAAKKRMEKSLSIGNH